MATVLIVGGTGFLGSNIINHLRRRHKVVALFRRQMIQFPGVSNFVFSFEDKDYVKRLMSIVRPDFIIYAVGTTNLLECAEKPQLADMLHSLGAAFIAQNSDTVPHRLIYLSSSYIYDGKKGSYNEDDVVLTETAMGRSKIAGENYVRSKSQTYTILRLSPVFGIGSIYHPSFWDRMRRDLAAGRRFEVPENETHSFLPLHGLLQALDWVIANETQNDTYNLGGLTKLTTYEFAQDFARKLGFSSDLLVPNRGLFKEQSMIDFSLDSTHFVNTSKINAFVLEEGLDLFQKQLVR